MTSLANLRWPEVPRALLAVPLGATEQHGPHLPLDTDTTVAEELARRLAERVPGVVVAPALPYGSSGEHAGFPGTLSIGQEALELVLVELARSADHFAGIVFVNGHGGNLEPLRNAVRLLRAEGRRVFAWAPGGPPDDTHAGRTETSVLLHLRPGDVLPGEPGNTEPLPSLIDRLVSRGVRSVSANGVLGDPTGATATEGEARLEAWTDALVTAVRDWQAG
ncbi:mycofactocin biosynthesis peptidyl-dipeptidase MftE [Prauserella sp. PE36]|uniref:mycofactocin biosynthesis peptidyl-dipeptidase MftE n=1 Tax=Prauserella sp. PE36 TaxID=1504709 RepID=UPI000D98134A|nr:mycofactocin biosynthesis peptidyl-dipeptidase MftE [Prauserella sp. PE36]PXY25976.1 mycofactocin system creatininase family protein [Prauserella coralliicola]RBM24124.1 mycofactocin biosynthesis peptidyl-dipeptidase MftE [Prauserella sp. PE36]